MAYDGKIAGHFPGRGNPNLDTNCIKYLREGASTPTSVSQMDTVKEVYAVGVNETPTLQTLDSYLVWRYFDELQNDGTTDQYLLFAIKPTVQNISLHSLSIMTDTSGTGNIGHVIVLSDDGLLLYSLTNSNFQESTANETIYGYTGIKRTITLYNDITLYARKTYWIHFHFDSCHSHRGPYFNGFNGHACLGKYKNFGNSNNFNIETYANSVSAYPNYANIKISSWQQLSSWEPYNLCHELIQANLNTALYQTENEHDAVYIRNNTYKDETYKGRIIADGSGGNEQWGINQSDWNSLNLSDNDYFILRNRYNGQQVRVCKCTNSAGDPNSSYTVEAEYSGTENMLSDMTNKIGTRSSFIQYYNGKQGTSYWNTTYTDKRFYLEINGNERCAGDERK